MVHQWLVLYFVYCDFALTVFTSGHYRKIEKFGATVPLSWCPRSCDHTEDKKSMFPYLLRQNICTSCTFFLSDSQMVKRRSGEGDEMSAAIPGERKKLQLKK